VESIVATRDLKGSTALPRGPTEAAEHRAELPPKQSRRPEDQAVRDRERGAFAGDAQRTRRESLKGSTAQPRGPPGTGLTGDSSPKDEKDEERPPWLALSIAQFCKAHAISEDFFYKLMRQGEAPRLMKVGARTLISIEAAAEWRRAREQATAIPSE
jgi:predicted DNA-binding transcriptional regulator AlpA